MLLLAYRMSESLLVSLASAHTLARSSSSSNGSSPNWCAISVRSVAQEWQQHNSVSNAASRLVASRRLRLRALAFDSPTGSIYIFVN